ncbi:uncharacterized protein LOC127702402 [Mytilus californianus]|uniref:uncharacterized protein LOC127702402 n=1 Tax=Mytilus californianus TaxID=6549 RepID=UPI002245BDB5|nr:uncharacterized protein LOC127702402 [Mytilus californianus]
MATSGHEKEKEIFTCCICLEQLKSPSSLPCLHTFCFQCISEYILSTERRSGHKLLNYTCPVCRITVTPSNVETDTTQWIKSLQRNLTISPLIETTKEPQNQECHICKRKKKHISATKWCRDCTEAYCDDCCDTHSFITSLTNHKVVDIKSIQTNEEEIDLFKISDSCPVHSSKVIEAYCFDHLQLCCVLCVTYQHRQCKDVQAIEDLTSKKDDSCSFESNLTEIQSGTEKLLQAQKDEKITLKKSFSSIESIVIDSVNSAKSQLDSLLISFSKELKMMEEKHQDKIDSKLDIFEKLLNDIIELLRITTYIRAYGSKTHFFIHLQKSKTELISEIEKSVKLLFEIRVVKTTVDIENALHRIMKLEQVGKVLITEGKKEFVAEYIGILRDQSHLHASTVFPYLHLIKRKLVHVLSEYDLFGGVCISDQTIALCCRSKSSSGSQPYHLIIVDASTGKVINECKIPDGTKGLTYDTLNTTLYISSSSTIYSVRCDQQIMQPRYIKHTGTQYYGGICMKDNYLYVNVGTEIKKMNLNQNNGLQAAFSINSSNKNPSGFNALTIDYKNGRLIHASENGNVVSTSLDGKEIFSHYMTGTTSVVVNSNGFIFAGYKHGYVRLILEDGEQDRTLLGKCDKIKELRDIWLNKSENTLFICGNEYVELYDVTY